MITINGIKLEIDFTDADVQERYNEAGKRLGAAKYGKLSTVEMTRKAAQNVRRFIDEIYGEGTGGKVLPKDSAADVMRAVDQIVEDARAQFAKVAELGEKFRSLGANEK